MKRLTHKEYEDRLFNIEADLYPIEDYQGNRVKIKHQCVYGHIVEIKPNAILDSRNGCSTCARRKLKTPTEYEAELAFKQIKPLEDYTGAHNKIWHSCLVCDNSWLTKPAHLVSIQNSGCPTCAKKFDPSKPTKVYYVKIQHEDSIYYKIGVTQKANILDRFVRDKHKAKFKILLDLEFESGYSALKYEKDVLDKYSGLRHNAADLLSSGNTELFLVDVLDLDMENYS